jgi:hypothetical protein
MDRGPWALFGAIVSVGLGPAMWLGVQFGEATAVPVREQPPVTQVQRNEVVEPGGGVGAGLIPSETPEPAYTPSTTTARTAKAKRKTTSPTPSHSTPDNTVSPAPSESAEPPAPGDGESEGGGEGDGIPPIESTTLPDPDPSSGSSGHPPAGDNPASAEDPNASLNVNPNAAA